MHGGDHDRISQYADQFTGDRMIRNPDADGFLVGFKNGRNLTVGIQDKCERSGKAVFHQPENRVVEGSRVVRDGGEVVTDEGEIAFPFFHSTQSLYPFKRLIGADVAGQGVQGVRGYDDNTVVTEHFYRFLDVAVVDVLRVDA